MEEAIESGIEPNFLYVSPWAYKWLYKDMQGCMRFACWQTWSSGYQVVQVYHHTHGPCQVLKGKSPGLRWPETKDVRYIFTEEIVMPKHPGKRPPKRPKPKGGKRAR